MALRTLRVFISSPGDVAEERVIARRVIGRLDSQFGERIAEQDRGSFFAAIGSRRDSDVVVREIAGRDP